MHLLAAVVDMALIVELVVLLDYILVVVDTS